MVRQQACWHSVNRWVGAGKAHPKTFKLTCTHFDTHSHAYPYKHFSAKWTWEHSRLSVNERASQPRLSLPTWPLLPTTTVENNVDGQRAAFAANDGTPTAHLIRLLMESTLTGRLARRSLLVFEVASLTLRTNTRQMRETGLLWFCPYSSKHEESPRWHRRPPRLPYALCLTVGGQCSGLPSRR